MRGSGVQSSLYDQMYEDIDAGIVFMGGGNQTSTAGNRAHVQLHNPGGSGVEINIINAWVQDTLATELGLFRTAAPYTVLVTAGINLLVGGASGLGEVRRQNGGGVPVTPLSEVWANSVMPSVPFFERAGFQLGPGEGVVFQPIANVSQMIARFLWRERPA
jgi:hypothetical protein